MFQHLLRLSSLAFITLATAVEPIRELKSKGGSAEVGQIRTDYQMSVTVKPDEFVLLTYKEYEGRKDGPEDQAKRVVQRLIRPLASPHQEVLRTDLFFHPGTTAGLPTQGKSTVGGFGISYANTDLAFIGSSGGSRSESEQPVYVSKKFKFGDDLSNPQIQKSVRFTLEVISENQMISRLKSADVARPIDIPRGWNIGLPEVK
jgi:hypothetical protein